MAWIDVPAITMQLVLASASPSRKQLLVNAGIDPIVRVSEVDEEALAEQFPDATPKELCLLLAEAKARDVSKHFPNEIVIGCDSVFEFDGIAHGKPGTAEAAKRRWHAMAGKSGQLHTGHCVIYQGTELAEVATSTVTHGEVSEAELDAYIATGEPLQGAGGFTLEGLGGPFIERIDGDPSNVIGLSLPLVRRMLNGLGVTWTDLWVNGQSRTSRR